MHRLTLEFIDEYGLGCIAEPTEIVDAEGRLIGTFAPSPEHRAELYRQANELITDEELLRRAEEPGGCTTEELLLKLSQL